MYGKYRRCKLLISAFVLAHAKSRFSHDVAQIIFKYMYYQG